MKLKWTLVDTRTGELRSGVDDYPYPPNSALFQWGDGNYACDCNRELFFRRAGNEPELDPGMACSGRFNVFELTSFVHVAADGTETDLSKEIS